jgi:Carboxypeptidase regulatory-like domain
MNQRRFAPLFLVLLFSLVLSPSVFGQAVTANMVGTITDSTGAAITQAKVTITEQTTNVSTVRQTNASGNFEFPNIRPGMYTVTAEHDGFQTVKSTNLAVVVNSSVRANLTLPIGAETQQIEVTAEGSLLQTDRADVTTNIDARQAQDLPNLAESQNYQALTSLAPGVTVATHNQGAAFDAQESMAFQVNGQSMFANNTQFEGIDDNERTGLLQIYLPSAQAIQAVNISTSNYAPEFGRAGGAVTNVVLRSGTNQFHGSLFEYNEVAALEARGYFNGTGPKAGLTNNYYGVTIGGPVLHNKMFFFGDFLRYDNHNENHNDVSLPTAAFRMGDFTSVTNKVIDPNTGKQISYMGVPNKIDPARFSPVALNILNLLPLPNVPGNSLVNNYVNNTGFAKDSNQFDVKVDTALRSADHLTLRYSRQQVSTFEAPTFGLAGGSNGQGLEGTGVQNAYNTAAEYVRVISPRLVMEARAGVSHYRNIFRQSDYGTQASTAIGVPGVNLNDFTSGLVGVTLGNNFVSPFVGYAATAPWDRGESNIDAVNSWTAVVGNHSIKFGGEVRRIRDDIVQGATFSPRGLFTYSDGPTSSSTSGKTGASNFFASFLLDLPSSVGRDINVEDASWRQTLYFAYVQDTWQASPRLTLLYGGRWELYPPPTPKRSGGFSNYDPSTNSLDVAGIGSVPKNLGVKTNYGDVAPRVGFTYRIANTTVVRGGFGVSYESFPDNQYAFNPPVRQNNAYLPAGSTAFGYPGVALLPNGNRATLAQGFPAAAPIVVPSSGIIPNADPSAVYYVVNKNYRDPYVISYNFTFAQELGKKFTLDLGYVGNQGREIPAGYNLNADNSMPGAGAPGQPLYGIVGGPNNSVHRVADTDLLGIGTNSNYNSMQLRVTRTTSHGLTSTTSYTYGKAMGYISSSTALGYYSFYIEPQRNYARLGWDQTHMFRQSFLYSLPFGAKGSYLKTGIAGKIIGGWEVGSVISLDSGIPLTFTASSTTYNSPGNTVVADQVAPFRKLKGIGVGVNWFDPTAFAQPTGVRNGNTGQNIYSGPAQFRFDANVTRNFAVTERATLQFRLNAFQVTNTPIFNNPGTSLTSSTFGTITKASGARQLQLAAILTF